MQLRRKSRCDWVLLKISDCSFLLCRRCPGFRANSENSSLYLTAQGRTRTPRSGILAPTECVEHRPWDEGMRPTFNELFQKTWLQGGRASPDRWLSRGLGLLRCASAQDHIYLHDV